jgi:hypothetical protein
MLEKLISDKSLCSFCLTSLENKQDTIFAAIKQLGQEQTHREMAFPQPLSSFNELNCVLCLGLFSAVNN